MDKMEELMVEEWKLFIDKKLLCCEFLLTQDADDEKNLS